MKVLTTAAVAAALLVAGCGGKDSTTEDAHDVPKCVHGTADIQEDVRCVDVSPKAVIANANGFASVAIVCDGHGHRLFITRNEGWTVVPDPTCPGYVKGQEPTFIVQP